ncbi:MAG: hypothetical protein ABSG55_10910 [Dehalococcoidia bacterium]|jgi:hypothetical protein
MRVHIAHFQAGDLQTGVQTIADPAERQRLLDAFKTGALFFTSEAYAQTTYSQERDDFDLIPVQDPQAYGDRLFFGISPLFITSDMQGRFAHTTIILMGCAGLYYDEKSDETSKDLLERGAQTIVG